MSSDGMTAPKWADAGVAKSSISAAAAVNRIELSLRIFASCHDVMKP
jgi:hypothetical protein